MLFATIFLVCFVLLGGVVMYLSQTIDHGEARFDSESGEQLPKDEDEARNSNSNKDDSASEDA